MKRILCLTLALVFGIMTPAFAEDKIGSIHVSGVVQKTMLHVTAVEDPANPCIVCYLTDLETSWSISDPSNNSVACRRICDQESYVGTEDLNIFERSKSIGMKELRVARFFDAKRQVLIYVVYSKKVIDGSLKHSISVVPLGAPLQ